MQNLTKIIVHHFGSIGNNKYVSTKNQSFENIDQAHKARWGGYRPSELDGSYVGYNIIIFPEGNWRQARMLGEETIAATGHNFDSVHIALAGNFTIKPDGTPVEMPTLAQIQTLKSLMISIVENSPETTKLYIKPNTLINIREITPHRTYADTDCYGTALSDYWIKSLVNDYFVEKINILTHIIRTLTEVINRNRLGKRVGDCLDNAKG